MKNTSQQMQWLLCIALAAMLCGCGGGNPNSTSYIGNTLVIDGTSYTGADKLDGIVPGEIIVTPEDGMREEVRRLIDRHGLRIAREERAHFLVTVPIGFEHAWADALKRDSSVAAATPNML